jgi:large subunit ribosomal protein L40
MSRLSLQEPSFVSRGITTTSVLMADPPKKKKKVDVLIVKMRVERKIRKLEKGIRKLKKTPKQLKPIEEYALPPAIIKNLDARTRKETQEDADMPKLSKIWIAYRQEEGRREQRCLKKIIEAQDKALQVLKEESPELYEKAISIDASLLPFNDNIMIAETPSNPNYTPPDGIKTDISKIWSM